MRNFNEIFKKDVPHDNIKSQKKAKLHSLLENYIFSQGERGKIVKLTPPPGLFRIKVLLRKLRLVRKNQLDTLSHVYFTDQNLILFSRCQQERTIMSFFSQDALQVQCLTHFSPMGYQPNGLFFISKNVSI